MKSFVVDVLDNVCQKNNKDVNATNLIIAAEGYGKVTDYEVKVAEIKAEYQGVIDDLRAQNAAIAEQKLTPAEFEFVKFLRKFQEALVSDYEKTIADIKAESEQKDARHKAFIDRMAATFSSIITQCQSVTKQ